jgi:serine protease Do
VVGINAQIYSTTGGYQGLSFAIPINVAVNVKNQIVRTGGVEHAQLGVEVQSLTPALASSFNRSPASGALVARVTPYSAAANAGLKPGDIILSYNQQSVSDAGDLSAKVGSATPGDTVTLQVWRDDHSMDLRVHLRPAGSAGEGTLAGSPTESHESLGLDVRPLTPEERQQSGVSGGLLVRDASGRAADAGVEAGDIVLAVDGTSVNSAGQLRALVSDHKAVALLVQRGDQRMYLPLQLG